MPDTATAILETIAEPGDNKPRRITPEVLAMLRPHALSRWSARVFLWGETRYSESENPFIPKAPLVIRTPATIGKAFAETCVGTPVLYGVRPDNGLRVGTVRVRSGDAGRLFYLVGGYIETAVADDYGIVASLLINTSPAHQALLDLAAHDALADAALCLNHDVTGTLRRTRWGLPVVDVTHARACVLDMTSQSHTAGARVLRRLEPDEPLGERDFCVPSRLHIPSALSSAPTEAATAEISVGTVTTSERQDVNSATHSPTWPSGGGGVVKSVEYSVSVSIGENYMGSWWADLPGSVTFDSAQAYGMVPVKQDTSSAKAWATTTLNIPLPTAIQGTFYYWSLFGFAVMLARSLGVCLA